MRSAISNFDATNGNQTRDALIAEHVGLVHHVARKMHSQLSTEASLDDLVSAGSLGLISAADNFDPARGVAFSTFALPRIRGAILDDLRDQDNVPRSMRRNTRALNKAREAVSQREAGAPAVGAVAKELGVDVDTIWEWDASRNAAQRVSLEQWRSEEPDADRAPWQFASDDEPVDATMERQEMAEQVRASLEQLQPRDRQLLALYYYEELTQQQIAQILGVTESRVSQLRTQAIARLRKLMAPMRTALVS